MSSEQPEEPVNGEDFMHFLYIVLGSIAEFDTQVLLAKELRFTEGSEAIEKAIEDVRK